MNNTQIIDNILERISSQPHPYQQHLNLKTLSFTIETLNKEELQSISPYQIVDYLTNFKDDAAKECIQILKQKLFLYQITKNSIQQKENIMIQESKQQDNESILLKTAKFEQ